jgi:hypothetical protein
MTLSKILYFALIASLAFLPEALQAGNASRALKRMKGFTIVETDTIAEVVTDRNGDKYFKLQSGTTFKVEMVLLDPLALSDVVIFAKAPSKEILAKYGKTIPEAALYQFKLLVGDDVYDASPAQ